MQQRVLDFITAEISDSRPCPTLREICTRFGFRSPRAAACHLEALRKKGLISWDQGKSRTLRVISPIHRGSRFIDVPLFGSIPAGLAEDRAQEPEAFVSVDEAAFGFMPTGRTFALRVSGNSMIGKHICEGDIALLEHGVEPRPGQTVAALIDGRSTLKTFRVKHSKPYLQAENTKYPDQIPCEELMVQGVLRGIIRKVRD